MDVLASSTLAIGRLFTESRDDDYLLDLCAWGKRREVGSARQLADQLEQYSFTERGVDASALKKQAAKLRNFADRLEKIANATSTD